MTSSGSGDTTAASPFSDATDRENGRDAVAWVHFRHRVTQTTPNGLVYCHCAPHHPFNGQWAHSVHVAALIAVVAASQVEEQP
jgi:hypothetical protein